MRRLDALGVGRPRRRARHDAALRPGPRPTSAASSSRSATLHVELPKKEGDLPRIDGHVHVRAPDRSRRAGRQPAGDRRMDRPRRRRALRRGHDPSRAHRNARGPRRPPRPVRLRPGPRERGVDPPQRRRRARAPRSASPAALVTLSDTVVDAARQGRAARAHAPRRVRRRLHRAASRRSACTRTRTSAGTSASCTRGLLGHASRRSSSTATSRRRPTPSASTTGRPRDRARERLFGFSEAQLAAHVAIRTDALKFADVHATLPRSHGSTGASSRSASTTTCGSTFPTCRRTSRTSRPSAPWRCAARSRRARRSTASSTAPSR